MAGPPVDFGPRYIPGFDGIRAIAVLMVMISHVGYGNVVPGGFGVTIFFAISGYLITTLLLLEIVRTGSVNVKLFYARRVLRLYPEMIVLILLCLAAGMFLPFTATIAEKLAGPFYYMNYYYVFGAHYTEPRSYPWRQLWSLAVEEHFYIFFPWLMMVVARTRRSRIAWISFLIAAPLVWRFICYYAIGLPWQYNYVATDTRIDSIAWGCMLAVLLRTADGGVIPVGKLWFVRPWLVAVALALVIFSLVYRSEDFRWTVRFTIQGIALALLIGNLLFDPRWRRIVSMLEFPPLRFVGRISYGLYLYHMLINRIISDVAPGLGRPAMLVVSIALGLAAATTSYFVVETPLKNLRRRLGSHVR